MSTTWSFSPTSGTFGTILTITTTNFTYNLGNPNLFPWSVVLQDTVNPPSSSPYVNNNLIQLVSNGTNPYSVTWVFQLTSQNFTTLPPPDFYRIYLRDTNHNQNVTTRLDTEFELLPICFGADMKITCLLNNTETDIAIQDLKKGQLVKTYKDGFLPIHSLGKSTCHNPKNNNRIKSRMYILKKNKYNNLTEDLIITGCHSLLVPYINDEQSEKIKETNGHLYVTDDMYRLPVYLDDNSDIYTEEYGDINVYHIALGDNEHRNYGIFANGLLVESCFINRIKNEMTLIN
jgi:hypothetical protein